ncbi:unnamed protein product [Medioppia subpectinata]|uniref:CUE domain-containing protein n=1 Tax=Medioppia subpectinata TaxID=1979941 RepID=A0A7R9L7U1_9ACAR|nr:unnamed protein product [Medioppia subpectinata]CAG2115808.1 unnamed protein product [Medioppia subpectinata]
MTYIFVSKAFKDKDKRQRYATRNRIQSGGHVNEYFDIESSDGNETPNTSSVSSDTEDETNEDYNGAKNPKWNKVFHCYLPQGVDSFHVEIYDECSFTIDEMIAWVLYKIPETTLSGQTVEEWVDLNGKQGDGKEGQICIVTSFTPLNKTALQNTGYPVAAAAPNMVPVIMPNQFGVVYGNNPALPQVYVQPGPPPTAAQALPQPIVISEEDVKLVSEMFPNVEIDVIKAIMETQRGNKDRTINSLLQMTSETN